MREPSETQPGPRNHLYRVLGLFLGLTVLIFSVQAALRPADYGRRGSYREGSLPEIMSARPVHLGKEVCATCHAEIFEKHEKDFHFDVECEDCHGPGRRHVLFHRDSDASVSEAEARMPKKYTREGCLFCHRRLAARPRTFPQVRPEEHYAFVGVVEEKTECIRCHSPHEPIFLLTEVRQARIHPAIFECRHCHDTPPKKDHHEVPGHPTIFTCRDCHEPVVLDFRKRKHAFLRCTACHLFHSEGETAGRIMKNGNRRFCLLCHERADFRDGNRTPLIEAKSHLADAAELLEIPPEEIAADPRICLRCHRSMIHARTGRK